MQPYVVEQIVAPDGTIVTRTKPDASAARSSRRRARELTEMMRPSSGRHRHGRADPRRQGRRQDRNRGDRRRDHVNTAWFIAFAPADNPQVAVAVVLENQSGTGGATRRSDREADHGGAPALNVD